MTSHTKKDITIIDKHLNIGAEDLIRGVEYTYCGDLHLLVIRFRRKKWLHRYCIISQGFLYIYLEMSSKKVEHVYSLKEFSSAQVCEPQEGRSYCFHLIFKSLQSPQLFACDTDERKQEWVEHFSKIFEYIHSLTDSGFGSAEGVLAQTANPEKVQEAYSYVNKDKVPKAITHTDNSTKVVTTSSCDSDSEYEPVSNEEIQWKQTKGIGTRDSSGKESETKKHLKGPRDAGKLTGKTKFGDVLHELKTEFKEKNDSHSNESRKQAKLLRDGDFSLTIHKSSSGTSFVSVRGGDHVNKDDTSDERRDSSLEPVYECTEPQHFLREEYFCNDKRQMKRELDNMPEGTFAICPGESSELVLSVKIENGPKLFRIFSQNGELSLFRSPNYKTFSSLDELLAFYRFNDLPNHSVKLVRGYNSGSK